MNRVLDYKAQLYKSCPELPIESVVFNDDGQYNDVLIVNDSLVFRFATVPDAVDTLHQEIAILNAIPAYLTLSIPNPIYANAQSITLGETFVGYRLIPGRPLWHDTFAEIGDPLILDRLAKQLAHFLSELHNVPTEVIAPLDLPLEDTKENWTTMYDQFREKLFPHMRPDACAAVTKAFTDYLSEPSLHHFEPCLRHGDFGGGNILFDPESGSISGIIDFGCTCLGDPAVDFGALFGSFGQEFYDRCTVDYPMMEAALPRVKFALGTFALQEALFGIENGDQEAFESGIAEYR